MGNRVSEGAYRFVFYASDWEQPPHVHVQREHRIGKFWLDPVKLERSGGFERAEARRITKILRRDQDLFLKSWREYFSRDVGAPEVERVDVTEDALTAELSDGRAISAPLDWYPRLVHATPQERENWELIGSGEGVPLARPGRGHQRPGADRRTAFWRGHKVLPALAQGKARGPPSGVQRVR